MHRRLRHLNPRFAGADSYYDTRYLTGYSNNDPVSVWSDVAGKGRDAIGTGTTSANPVYKTNVQAGQPCLRSTSANFTRLDVLDGIDYNDKVTFIGILKDNNVSRSILFGGGWRSDVGQANDSTFGGSGPTNQFFFQNDNFFGGVTLSGITVTNVSTYIGTRSVAGYYEVYQDGVNKFSNTTSFGGNIIAAKHLFCRSTGATTFLHSDGDFFYGATFPTNLTVPLSRRLAIAAAMSFKVRYN
jgi:hypothetical protein